VLSRVKNQYVAPSRLKPRSAQPALELNEAEFTHF
jgi:hypothetical protein